MGLDIGTTSISAVVADGSGNVLESRTLLNDAAVTGKHDFERIQDPKRILDICAELRDDILSRHRDIVAIGITGQMHGILYVDRGGKAVSPFYTWQDMRGNRPFKDGHSYASWLSTETGYSMATGFGLTTHFYMTVNGLVPQGSVKICNITDFVGMSFSGGSSPVLHPSMAASFGIYDVKSNEFDGKMAKRAGIDPNFLPAVDVCENPIGTWRDIQITPSIGDNQASFLGSMNNESRILVNIGTSSQISIFSGRYETSDVLDCRPYIRGNYILVGSPLCGGYAYHILRDFFIKTAEFMGLTPPDDMYDRMNAAAAEFAHIKSPLVVDTRYNGTREDPSIRGAVTNIHSDTLLPGALCIGTLRGICDELHRYWVSVRERIPEQSFIVASGNGVRKNRVLQSVIAETFGMSVNTPVNTEEACCGGAMFALLVCGGFSSLEELMTKIRYTSSGSLRYRLR